MPDANWTASQRIRALEAASLEDCHCVVYDYIKQEMNFPIPQISIDFFQD
jgi:hypothetical protein